MINKTTRAYQVNQPRPPSLPEYISDAAWVSLSALPSSLCATLELTYEGEMPTAVRLLSEEGGDACDMRSAMGVSAQLLIIASRWAPLPDLAVVHADIVAAAEKAAAIEAVSDAARAIGETVKVVPTPKKKRGT